MSEWISFKHSKERPEEGATVLFYLPDFMGNKNFIVTTAWFSRLEEINEGGCDGLLGATHWMPCPAPPVGDDFCPYPGG